MAYFVPLKYALIGKGIAVCVTRIVTLLSMDAHMTQKLYKKEKLANTLINASGRDKTRSLVVMDNGSVIGTNYSVSRLLKAIENASEKYVNPPVYSRKSKAKSDDPNSKLLDEILEGEDQALDSFLDEMSEKEEIEERESKDGAEEEEFDDL